MPIASHTNSPYGEKLYEGKAKIIYRAKDGTLFHYFKDSATAFNAQKKAEFKGKGTLNVTISSLLFTYLKDQGVPSHFITRADDRTFQTLALTMIPAEVVVRNRVAGSLAKRLNEKEGQVLEPPVVEFYLKDDAKGDPLVSEDLLISLYQQKMSELAEMKRLALRVNEVLSPLFKKVRLILADFKLEFGKTPDGKILLADEISPDTCRFWDAETGEKWDKDRFRFDLGDLITGYEVVLNRLEEALIG